MAIPRIHARLMIVRGGQSVRIRIFLRRHFLDQGYVTSFLNNEFRFNGTKIILPFLQEEYYFMTFSVDVKKRFPKIFCSVLFRKESEQRGSKQKQARERRTSPIMLKERFDTPHIVCLN